MAPATRLRSGQPPAPPVSHFKEFSYCPFSSSTCCECHRSSRSFSAKLLDNEKSNCTYGVPGNEPHVDHLVPPPGLVQPMTPLFPVLPVDASTSTPASVPISLDGSCHLLVMLVVPPP